MTAQQQPPYARHNYSSDEYREMRTDYTRAEKIQMTREALAVPESDDARSYFSTPAPPAETIERKGKNESLRKKVRRLRVCYYCGTRSASSYEADHIFPRSRGGRATQRNMACACKSCNRKKGSTPETEFRKIHGLATRYTEALLPSIVRA